MKKGFTLIELLAVIIILALLSIVTVTNIMKSYDKAKDKAYDLMIQDIENATGEYVNAHPEILDDLTVANPIHTIYLSTLIEEFLIKDPVMNPKTGEAVDTSTAIDIRLKTDGDVAYDIHL